MRIIEGNEAIPTSSDITSRALLARGGYSAGFTKMGDAKEWIVLATSGLLKDSLFIRVEGKLQVGRTATNRG